MDNLSSYSILEFSIKSRIISLHSERLLLLKISSDTLVSIDWNCVISLIYYSFEFNAWLIVS